MKNEAVTPIRSGGLRPFSPLRFPRLQDLDPLAIYNAPFAAFYRSAACSMHFMLAIFHSRRYTV